MQLMWMTMLKTAKVSRENVFVFFSFGKTLEENNVLNKHLLPCRQP